MSHLLQITRTDHYNLCQTLEAELSKFEGQTYCAFPGLEFLLPGTIPFEVESRGVTQKADTKKILVFNGSEVHREKYENATGALRSLVIPTKFMDSVLAPLDIDPRNLIFDDFVLSGNHGLETELAKVWQALHLESDLSQFTVDSWLTAFISQVISKFSNTASKQIEKTVQTGAFPHSVSKAKKVFHEHLANAHFTLDDLSRECGMSKFHLIRTFKKETGASPARYLNQLRIDIAKQLLVKTDKSIIEISQDSGFNDLSTFNKAFKRLTDMSPTTYRQNQIG